MRLLRTATRRKPHALNLLRDVVQAELAPPPRCAHDGQALVESGVTTREARDVAPEPVGVIRPAHPIRLLMPRP
jgi:hypothetical protein